MVVCFLGWALVVQGVASDILKVLDRGLKIDYVIEMGVKKVARLWLLGTLLGWALIPLWPVAAVAWILYSPARSVVRVVKAAFV